MEKIRTKCCPFCGCDQVTYQDEGDCGYAYIMCDQCHAKGPEVDKEDLMPGFVETASDEELDAELEALAANRWNCRPPMTDVFPEDLAAFDQFGETVGADIRSENDG